MFLRLKSMIIPLSIVLVYASCGPGTTKITVQRPPNFNTAGVRSIAIMPFECTSGCEDIARHATAITADRIAQTNHFILVDSSEVGRLMRSGQNLENHVDAVLRGSIVHCNTQQNFNQGSAKDKKGKTEYYTAFITVADVSLNYSLVKTRDGGIIGPVAHGGTHDVANRETYTSILGHAVRNSQKDNPRKYPSTNEALFAAVDHYLSSVATDFAPYSITENRRFAEDKTNDKDRQAAMKNAHAQVREGNFRLALTSYQNIYEQYKSFAAAENASILHEALGDNQAAADIIKRVYDDTGNPKAKEILDRLNQILKDQATIDAGR